MLRLLLFMISLPVFSAPRWNQPPGGFQDNVWQRAQIQHLQTQQQLQEQDQYRRLLLLQDQQRQLQQVLDQQGQFEYMQRNSTMHQHSDRLRMYSQPIRPTPKKSNNKPVK